MKDLITVAIPVYNELEALVNVIEEVKLLTVDTEIIIIDDGSTFPETKNYIELIIKKYPDITVIRNHANLGKSVSVLNALNKAHGNIFVILDSDGELDPRGIEDLYREMKLKKSDLVNGTRVVAEMRSLQTKTNLITRLAKKLIRWAFSLFYGYYVDDILSGYKMFKTKAFDSKIFISKRFGLETEMIARAIIQNLKISQIAVKYLPRTYKQGKKINLWDGIEMLKILLKLSERFQKILDILIPVLIALIAFSIYTHSLSFFHTTDALPNTITAINYIQNNRLDLSNIKSLLIEKDLIGIAVENDKGDLFPKTPIIISILSAPWVWLANKWYGVNFIDLYRVFENNYIQYLGKITASAYTSLSLGIMYLVLRNFKYSRYIALATILIGMLGTGYFNTISQANWSHAFSIFFISIYLLFISGRMKSSTYFICGILIGILTQIRISNIFFLLVLPIYTYLKRSLTFRKILQYGAGFGIMYFGYSFWQQSLGVPYGYSAEIIFSLREITPKLLLLNLASILFSFNYGLLYFSPVLILILFAKIRKNNLLVAFLPTIILLLFFASIWWMWTGGMALNARLLSELLPIFLIFLASSLSKFGNLKGFQILILVLTLFSFAANILTTYMMDYSWHDQYLEKGGHRSQIHNAWVNNPSLLTYLMNRKYVTVISIQKKKDGLYESTKIYRPSIVYRGMPKIFDNSQKIFNYE